jgi:hypothetical protein
MKKPKQPLYYAVPSGERTMVFAAWSFTQAVETKNKLQAEYAETYDRDRVFAMYEITGEEFDHCIAHQATTARMLDNGLACFSYPVPNLPLSKSFPPSARQVCRSPDRSIARGWI